MAIRIMTDRTTGTTKVQFVLADDVHEGPVSTHEGGVVHV